MKTIGVDLHKCSLTATVLDDQGKVVERRDIGWGMSVMLAYGSTILQGHRAR